MTEDRRSFWTSLPGILTGIAAVLTASGGIYLGVVKEKGPAPGPSPSEVPLPAPSPSPEPATGPYKSWSLIAEETFTNASAWRTGNWSDERSTVDLRSLDGKFRWDVSYRGAWERYEELPYPPAVEFYAAVDAKPVESSIAEGYSIALLFGRASMKDYAFRLSSRGNFGLSRYDGEQSSMIVAWTPIRVDLNQPNRLAVLVENQRIKLFLNSSLIGEYRDTTFTGGKVGVALESFGAGTLVVDFDNFEFRRK